jgi:hypothetical protein
MMHLQLYHESMRKGSNSMAGGYIYLFEKLQLVHMELQQMDLGSLELLQGFVFLPP